MKKIKNKNEVFRIIKNVIFYAVIIFFLVIAAIIVKAKINNVQPEIFGYKFYSILTGSMSPEIEPGDIIIVKETNMNELTEGDIITFSSETSGNIITHRINKINNNEIITKGDANSDVDPAVVKEKQIIGKVTKHISKVGLIFQFIQNNLKIILLAIVLVTAIIMGTLKLLKKYNK